VEPILRPVSKNSLRKYLLSLLGLLITLPLAGCQPGVTPIPVPSPQVISLQVTPGLLSLQPYYEQCVVDQPNTGLVISTTATLALAPGNNLALRWWSSADPGIFAAIVGQEELVMIVSQQNPLQAIQIDDLQAIYTGTMRTWPGNQPTGEVQPWTYPNGEDTSEVFAHVILNGTAPPRKYTYLAPDPSAMQEAVSANQNAIGSLPRRWWTDQVKEIQIQGLPLEDLSKPILVMSQAEPSSIQTDWILCLEERMQE